MTLKLTSLSFLVAEVKDVHLGIVLERKAPSDF